MSSFVEHLCYIMHTRKYNGKKYLTQKEEKWNKKKTREWQMTIEHQK